MTTATTTNGVRKTLASQIDRLDSILDGLSEGLNEAVATAVQGAVELAVRQAVGQAVKEAVQRKSSTGSRWQRWTAWPRMRPQPGQAKPCGCSSSTRKS